ncbi:DNA topoisomerase 4 subunit A [Trichothermofontia sichuanensis B231]|uniref:DNA gyrase/topoisomerase IV subunit A n=1 Tax=Trichothermofontia sichuanensis TaxID=3045816 RepID=UPI002245F8EE|nr:DNA topoisomerase (ATP-hydrolyzing) [Trichothermofontia sichuanensis]UZQ55042.1 DNA topoisomerase 4 subunit A [Trichothermofontia sichuanensis B231]
MAKQLNLLSSGQVVTTALHTEMQRSYLEYAMSVIVGRALPDVRDGLKPVHRRILYAMHELGLTPDRPYRKCARVVGDVLGKYHPHGDQAVYDALVRLTQTFASRYPLLDGHGNFGSIDDDPPAAMRYTETRLAPVSHEALLGEIGAATVDFIDNFDGSQQEPIVLPAQLPILLLNGSSGIAVGMATNIPPHNLGEVVDALIALIDRPDLPDTELFKIIPGPDFPTGGEIVGTAGSREAQLTGRGSIPVRGVAQLEEIQPGRGRHRRNAIVITELPYQVNKAALIEKIADLVNQGKIDGIADLRDESDREGIRVVVELKREANPQSVLDHLYKQTPLQSNFGAILLALVDGQPRQLSLRQILTEFLQFREATLTRRYRHELEQTEKRCHLVKGMLHALAHLDAVIDLLCQAPDGSTAKLQLQAQFDLSDRQADAILAMPLRRLTGLEQANLQTEYEELTQHIQTLRQLLTDRRELLKTLKKDLRTLKRKYADPRRTRIVENEALRLEAKQAQATDTGTDTGEDTAIMPLLPATVAPEAEEVVLTLTQRGYVRRLSPRTFQRQQRRESDTEDTSAIAPLEEAQDVPIQVQAASTDQELLVVTATGKAYTVAIGEIPATTGRSRGTAIVGLLPPAVQSDPEPIVAQWVLPKGVTESDELVLLSKQGRIKRIPLAEVTHLTNRGLVVTKLKEGDTLAFAVPMQTATVSQIVLATSSGRLLRLPLTAETVPLMNRNTQGVQVLRLRPQETVVGCVALGSHQDLLLVSQQGYAKRLPLNMLRLSQRGELGTNAFQFATKTDRLVAVLAAPPEAEVILITNTQRYLQLPIAQISVWGRDGSGDRCCPCDRGEVITTVAAIDPPVW